MQNDGTLILYEPDTILYNDVGAMERDHWASHLVRFTARAADIVLTNGSPAWRFIHTTYAICEEDLLFTEDLQRKTLENIAAIDTELLEDCGHCPMISGPEKILAIVMAIAGEQASTYDGTSEETNVNCQCMNSPVFGNAFGKTDAGAQDPPRPQPCVCAYKCVCHHNDGCPFKVQYSTMNPDCPCSYGEYFRRVSTAAASGGTSAISGETSVSDPVSSNYSGESESFRDELAAFDNRYRDPYESWDTGLATIGSVVTTTELNDREIEAIARDDASLRPGMRRTQSVTPEPVSSEDGSVGKQTRDDNFLPKLARKNTTLPL